jgi:hypothetical protein
MRFSLLLFLLLAVPLGATEAQLSIQIGTPSLSIQMRQQHYPTLVAVPGYPVYYDPNANGNYFFYDGMYWVFEGDNWYASDWFNGPWALVDPQVVPVFLLRVPVRYYRQPPTYFRGWQANSAPRWGEHWGNDWERRRGGWDRWDRRQVPSAAPLPTYQRQYSGDRYPRAEQQRALRNQNYRHEPRDEAVRGAYRQPPQREPPRQQLPQREPPRQQPPQREPPRQQPPQREPPPQQQPQREPPRQQQGDQGKGNQGRGNERGPDRGGERGNEHERDGGADRR